MKKIKSKPSYGLYIKLWYTLDTYLMTRIDTYIYFEYYEWDILDKWLIEPINQNDNRYIEKYIWIWLWSI